MGLIVYRHSSGVYGRLRYTPGTGRVVAFIWGSEIQPTFSLRTFHNAHTAGVGQQVADYVAGVGVYARVGCQQNPLIVHSQSKRIESYAGIRHTSQLSMLFGSMVCDAF